MNKRKTLERPEFLHRMRWFHEFYSAGAVVYGGRGVC